MTLNCRGKLIDLSTPKVMGILNLTPDSFYDGGAYKDEPSILNQVEKMLNEGADFIDIGGMSSRPGAEIISEDEELKRIEPVLRAVSKHFPDTIISVDTIRAKVAHLALEAGVHIINDITAGRFEPEIINITARYKVPFVVMHMQGMPATMQKNPVYKNVITEVAEFLKERINTCENAAVSDVIIDVGFGFGKTLEHNYTLLRNLQYFSHLNRPILTGLSRKGMIGKILGVESKDALNGTTAANTLALLNGSSILRVHDVKEAKEAIKVIEAYQGAITG